MSSELRSKTHRAALWSLLEITGQRGVQFVVGVILARLLLPEEFGLIGMLLFFLALAQIFLDSGFGAALIQRQQITDTDINSIFYFNILVGFLCAGLLCLLAPSVAVFYQQPILKPLLRFLSLILIINAFGLIQSTLLVKAIDFKTQTKVSLLAVILSGGIGITLAVLNFGVWSLAVQQVCAALFRTVFLWVFSTWRPSRLFSLRSLKDLFHYAWKLLCSGFLNAVFDNLYYVVIGRLFPPAELGYFTRADNLQQLPSITLSSVAGRIAFPVFSTIQKEPERVKRGLQKALMFTALIHFPLMLSLGAAARQVVLVLLTEKWAPCILYLKMLSLVGMMLPLHVLNLNVLQALGRSDLFLRLELVKKGLVVLNLLIAWRWGIPAIILGQIVVSLLGLYLNGYFNKSLIRYSFWEQIQDLSAYLNPALIAAAAVYLIGLMPISSPAVQLLLQVAVGTAVYLGLSEVLRLEAYLELRRILVGRLQTLRG
ncbi:MAG: lipopolysaccharide biosynthesis protein [Anaerohalosphaeraceae bacterium]